MSEESLNDEVIFAKYQIDLISSTSYEESLPIGLLLDINNYIKKINH